MKVYIHPFKISILNLKVENSKIRCTTNISARSRLFQRENSLRYRVFYDGLLETQSKNTIVK